MVVVDLIGGHGLSHVHLEKLAILLLGRGKEWSDDDLVLSLCFH